MAREAERARTAQGDLGTSGGGGGELDGFEQHGGGIGLDVGGEREPELEPARPPRPRSGGGSASARRRKIDALSGAPRVPARPAAARSTATVAASAEGRCAVDGARRAPGRRARARAAARRVGVPERALAGAQARVQGAAISGCASAIGPSPWTSPAARSPSAARAACGGSSAARRAAWRSGAPRPRTASARASARRRRGAGSWRSTPARSVGPERAQLPARRPRRADLLGHQVAEQRARAGTGCRR